MNEIEIKPVVKRTHYYHQVLWKCMLGFYDTFLRGDEY